MEKTKHIFIRRIDQLLDFVKDNAESRSNIALKRLDAYKTCATISFKAGDLEARHYRLFNPMIEKICSLHDNGDLDGFRWISEKEPAFHVMFVGKSMQSLEDLSIDFPSLFSLLPGEYEKLIFVSKVISLLSLTCDNNKYRSTLESYKEYVADMIDDLSDDEGEDPGDFNQFLDKAEQMITNKETLKNAMSRFGSMYNKIKNSDVGEALSASIPDGQELTADTIKATISNVQNRLNATEVIEEKPQ